MPVSPAGVDYIPPWVRKLLSSSSRKLPGSSSAHSLITPSEEPPPPPPLQQNNLTMTCSQAPQHIPARSLCPPSPQALPHSSANTPDDGGRRRLRGLTPAGTLRHLSVVRVSVRGTPAPLPAPSLSTKQTGLLKLIMQQKMTLNSGSYYNGVLCLLAQFTQGWG